MRHFFSIPVILAVLLFSSYVSSNSVHALDCVVNDLSVVYEYSDQIFEGEVVEINENGNSTSFTFIVKRLWKGTDSSIVDVVISKSDLSWGAIFEEGQTYTVFANKVGDRYEFQACGLSVNSADYANRSEYTELINKYGEGVEFKEDMLGDARKENFGSGVVATVGIVAVGSLVLTAAFLYLRKKKATRRK